MANAPQHPVGGLELGYARVSTTKQSLERQLDALTAAGLPDERIYLDKKSGAVVDRPGLAKLLDGDTIVAYTLDRLGWNLCEVKSRARPASRRHHCTATPRWRPNKNSDRGGYLAEQGFMYQATRP
ncbi:recombinase family protein [Nocardia sp. NPDC059154]